MISLLSVHAGGKDNIVTSLWNKEQERRKHKNSYAPSHKEEYSSLLLVRECLHSNYLRTLWK